ncbi:MULTISPECIES: helix-turn-helix domain-containing protein [Micromonospora]|uniref:DNA-binding protein n=1 Tax=Micromonospora solifontis TaxID=2487138 RepID=A0ABX9WKP4_9ACTN|nr:MULTISPECIES: helix-turn-helix domain-containing protein [Micromonospora]NES14613.1 helix-turn-helix domain-containing protein [Micromonospora sp. PPF5-17B]NES35249.1 helix-turn-helix domain-containing protein [Micromonospora solifontis]RNM00978.1 DNA-binding protein [Micromonospora solifontis]
MARDYTYAEAAAKLRIAETTLRRWVSKGRVPCHRLGRKVRFTEADLEAAYQACPALAGRR